jgi:potassium-transporting ATPase KdpC subunit
MKHVTRAFLVLVAFSLLLGIGYPLGLTGIATALFPRQSAGSLVVARDHVVGSELIGQMFLSPRYFHGRPSFTDPAYNASGSGGSNFGPTNSKLIEQAKQQIN